MQQIQHLFTDKTASFTMDELIAMESEEWKPTGKVLEFEKRHEIQRNRKNKK